MSEHNDNDNESSSRPDDGTAAAAVVAYLGPPASYTHQAALSHFAAAPAPAPAAPDSPTTTFDLRPQTSIEDVFAAVQSGAARFGVVPFENSSNGSVVFTLDLFADVHGRYPDILVKAEIYLAVRHCLLGHARRPAEAGAGDGDDLSHIRKLYSHPQAWGQCKRFLSRAALQRAERHDASSTSRAAELAAADARGTSAAVSSRVAAALNGLDVLADGIEDQAGNSTRFFVLRRARSSGSGAQAAHDSEQEKEEGESQSEAEAYKTLVSFIVPHDSPGALADALAVFKTHAINLTSIYTRPSGAAAWHYIFFIECKGRRRGAEGGGGGDRGGAVDQALRELDEVVETWRWLGSWDNRLKG